MHNYCFRLDGFLLPYYVMFKTCKIFVDNMPDYCSTDVKLFFFNLGHQKLIDLLYVCAIHEQNHTDLPISLNVVKMCFFTHISLKH